ncbi:MAG TPA: hypothetical protein VGZ47_23310 [Gemmataceae bacterium]|jgi:hypothetical protein|nr:hypothetical protein [Gemmataceae bacterium]
METVVALPNLVEMRRFVHALLCEPDNLDLGQTPLFEAPLKQDGRMCGLYFEIEGPRMLRTSAIWTEEENRLLFYDSTGFRFAEMRLSEAPHMGQVEPVVDGGKPQAEAA